MSLDTTKLNAAFADILRRFERDNMEVEEAAAKRNPKAHKLSRVFAKGNRYVYTPAGKDGRGRTIWFCRSTQRNVAGYFLVWRQIETKAKKKATKVGDLVSTTKRDQWTGFKSKKAAIALCRRRAERFRKAQAARRSPARPGI
jgi:Txe/YoeB family toxin of Txe-Axe toxin-antitoxin module